MKFLTISELKMSDVGGYLIQEIMIGQADWPDKSKYFSFSKKKKFIKVTIGNHKISLFVNIQ